MEDLLTPSRAFWEGKRVFLTGHTGFKGSWLAIWLTHLGAIVRGFSLPEDGLAPVAVEPRVEDRRGDIRDAAALATHMVAFAPDFVLHLAAQSLVQRSYQSPAETFDVNVMGTVRVLEAARACSSVRAIVVATTDKCYENREWVWPYRETDPLGGRDPYSASKAGTELVVAAWRQSFMAGAGVALASVRAGNVLGGGDWAANRLLPDCMRALGAGRSIDIRSPNATRPWQHVLEPLCGYLILAERLWRDGGAFAEAWNFGPATEDVLPVGRIVDHVVRLWGDEARWRVIGQEGGHEAGLLAVDSSKAHSRLGWRPRLRLGVALDWTVAWYKQHHAGADPHRLTRDDIVRFEQLGGVTP